MCCPFNNFDTPTRQYYRAYIACTVMVHHTDVQRLDSFAKRRACS